LDFHFFSKKTSLNCEKFPPKIIQNKTTVVKVKGLIQLFNSKISSNYVVLTSTNKMTIKYIFTSLEEKKGIKNVAIFFKKLCN
jgi:hypothetical protein